MAAAETADPVSEPDHWPYILVVEDQQDFAGLLLRQLEAFEYRATVHTSSLAALADFRSRPEVFDAVMTDNQMPGMTGIALAQEILRVRPELPVILVTGAAAATDPLELKAKGIRRLLRKPHTGREMDEALREVLNRL